MLHAGLPKKKRNIKCVGQAFNLHVQLKTNKFLYFKLVCGVLIPANQEMELNFNKNVCIIQLNATPSLSKNSFAQLSWPMLR